MAGLTIRQTTRRAYEKNNVKLRIKGAYETKNGKNKAIILCSTYKKTWAV